MNKEIRDYMNYEFPSIMETNPETIEAIMLDYFDDVKSINGLGYTGDEPSEDMMCYVQDRLINEKWEDDEENTMIRLFDISYDAPKSVQKELQKEFIVSAVELGWEEGDDLTEIIEGLSADFISDETDWLVNGFEYEILNK